MRIRKDVVLRRLIMARDLISTKGGWIKDDLALDSDGGSVEPHSKRAVSFCALGAIQRAAHADEVRRGDDAIFGAITARVGRQVPGVEITEDFDDWFDAEEAITNYNDGGTNGHRRRGVVSVFNRAIAVLKEELA